MSVQILSHAIEPRGGRIFPTLTGPTISLNPASSRALHFQQIFGRLSQIPVIHAIAHSEVSAQGIARQCYALDIHRLSRAERHRLTIFYAAALHVQLDEAYAIVQGEGVSILASDVTVEVTA